MGNYCWRFSPAHSVPQIYQIIAGGKEKLKELEETQPSSQSGGQDPLGIQDKVFVVRPDGTDFRVF